MAFLYYQKKDGKLLNTGDSFSLAGHNLIYNQWQKKGCPTDQGWHVTAKDLVKEHCQGNDSDEDGALIIDFDPNSKKRIGLLEILDIYIYTYAGKSKDEAEWSPMMLRVRGVFYEEYEKELVCADKANIISSIVPAKDDEDFVEFLYLNGEKYSWNWGLCGRTNAAFIKGEARDFFRPHF